MSIPGLAFSPMAFGKFVVGHSVFCRLCAAASAHHDAQSADGSAHPVPGSVSSCANGRNGNRDLHDPALPGAVHGGILCNRIAGHAPSAGLEAGRQARGQDDREAYRHNLLCDGRCEAAHRTAAFGDCGMAGDQDGRAHGAARSILALQRAQVQSQSGTTPRTNNWRLSAIPPTTIRWTNGSTTSLISMVPKSYGQERWTQRIIWS